MPPSDPIPSCAANASATLDEAIDRAWEFAPVVHFHYLEQTPLQVSLYRVNSWHIPLITMIVTHYSCDGIDGWRQQMFEHASPCANPASRRSQLNFLEPLSRHPLFISGALFLKLKYFPTLFSVTGS